MLFDCLASLECWCVHRQFNFKLYCTQRPDHVAFSLLQTYHVLNTTVKAAELKDGDELETLNGAVLTVSGGWEVAWWLLG